MKPQKPYYQWKEEQGLSVSGTDVANGDTVQSIPSTPAEDAIIIAFAKTLLFNRQIQDEK